MRKETLARHPVLPGFALLSVVIAVGACFCRVGDQAEKNPADGYSWRSVPIGGGGCVPDVVVHPRVKDLVYIRTDVGGFYRWNAAGQSWTPLMDSIPFKETNLYGGDSIAVDPGDKSGDTLYVATGMYTAEWAETHGVGTLMKSSDRGDTWQRLPLRAGGASNEDQLLGERLAVDPLNGQHLFYASKNTGLFESDDAGKSWNSVANGPMPGKVAGRRSGLSFCVFDKASGLHEKTMHTKDVFVGAYGKGVFLSQDGGVTWTLLAGGPTTPKRGAVGEPGTFFVSHMEGVAKYSVESGWTDISPMSSHVSFTAIAVNPSNPRHILTAVDQKGAPTLYASSDAGANWRQLVCKDNITTPWWTRDMWMNKIHSLAFDPFDPRRVWATDWFSAYTTEDINAETVVWSERSTGIEILCSIGTFAAPPNSKYRLYTCLADSGGFDHESIDRTPSENLWKKGFEWGTSTGFAWQPSNPDFLVRVGTNGHDKPGFGGAYSIDGGTSWVKFPSLPYKDVMGGRVAIAGNAQRIIWCPLMGAPYMSDDLAKTWRKVDFGIDVPAVMKGNRIFTYEQPLAVDMADPSRVYIIYERKTLRSDDAGDTWKVACDNSPAGNIIFTSGAKNDLWMTGGWYKGDVGLNHSSDGGVTWTRLPDVDSAIIGCAGKNPPGKEHATLFICGTVKGVDGFFRSDDLGNSWIRIDTMPGQRIGNDPRVMCGDWRVFGGVFVGTGGRGIFHGVPANGK